MSDWKAKDFIQLEHEKRTPFANEIIVRGVPAKQWFRQDER